MNKVLTEIGIGLVIGIGVMWFVFGPQYLGERFNVGNGERYG